MQHNAHNNTPHRLDIPPLWCPLPQALHPAWREMDAATVAWMKRFRLAADASQAQRFAAIGAGELGARVTGHADDLTRAQLAVDHLMWLFTFDDTFCDEGTYRRDPARMAFLAADLVRTAETGQPRADQPVMAALANLRCRLDRLGSPLQATRWVNALRAYLLYQVWEAGHRATATVPDLATFLNARIYNGAMPACVALLDISNGYELPAADAERPAVRALTEMCCAMAGFDNDLMSYWKETLRTHDGLNLIDVLAHTHHTRPEEVLTEAVALRDRVLAQYLRLRDQTLPTAAAPARRYITGLDAWIRANIDWGMHSRRYLNPDNPAVLPNTTATNTPTCTDTAPIPGITIWWNLTP